MTSEEIIRTLAIELDLRATEAVERDFLGHEVPDKKRRVEAKKVEALQFIIEHAMRNC